MRKIFLFALFSFLLLKSFAQNNEIEIVAEIKSVTVYNASAEIHYQKEIALPEGKSTIIFTELTPFIVENTINIIASNPDIDIITVTEKINYTKEKKETNVKISVLHDSINYIENELGLLRCKAEAYLKEKELLFKGESIGGVAAGVSVNEIEKASAFFSKRYLDLIVESFKLANKEKLLQSRLLKHTNQLNELSSNTLKSCSEIRVTVKNSSTKNVIFYLKFLTTKGGWAPLYDFKYQGSKNDLSLIFRANVFNASGVAWENINLKLSTATPTGGFDTPSLKQKNKSSEISSENDVKYREIEVSNNISEYDIKHKYTIPSDSKPYLIDVSSYNFNAEYNYLIIPKIDPFGFLMAKIPDWNKYNLISGTTHIYNKGSYMGKTFLNTYAENDTLSVYLGKDNTIQAVMKETNSINQHNIIGNYYLDKTSINISLKNNSSESLKIQVLDQVPVFSDNEKIKFSVYNIDDAVYNKTEGLVVWNFNLLGNENKILDYKYEIKIPKNDIGNYKPMKRRFRTISCPSF